ncbi:glycoside hydrolase family 25 protein [Terriglobus roseus]|uniref:Lysozyme n=1 Tax=Terriglobus roseus TaxID=392734 RepID=A0A1H4ITX8_9BACT|nr:glycoside hydrolase family 25 protein [Terriglobus roseus]SEB37519.1 lysozyme [Terriglobus roseus]
MAIDAIVDLSHHNNKTDLEAARRSGILGVIHKATQGLTYTDPFYAPHRTAARAAGLLWGAYHFGDGSDGLQQAERFLSVVGDPRGMLLVLDFEANPVGPSMSLEEARAFVTHVQSATGVWPGLYCGHYIKELLGPKKDPVLANCWLWIAQYGPTPVVPATWKTWTMWQYTDGAAGLNPKPVPGIGLCDRDQFNGTQEGLNDLWSAIH